MVYNFTNILSVREDRISSVPRGYGYPNVNFCSRMVYPDKTNNLDDHLDGHPDDNIVYH
ncbi:6546_t:CDS:2 [Gigaspora rosea]|nr:6546_t:CDS:2 [Gigaspora rosea]